MLTYLYIVAYPFEKKCNHFLSILYLKSLPYFCTSSYKNFIHNSITFEDAQLIINQIIAFIVPLYQEVFSSLAISWL